MNQKLTVYIYRNFYCLAYALLFMTFSCKGKNTDNRASPPAASPKIAGKSIVSISFPRKVIQYDGDLDGVDISKRIESVLDKIGVQVTTIRGAGTITSLEIKPFPETQLVDALKEAGLSGFVTMTHQ